MKRLHVFFTGIVQGVGFRYSTKRIANRLKISGWVKNLPDGRVESLCEGDKSECIKFLNQIKASHLGKYIRNVDITWMEATGEFDDFSVRFY